MSKSFATELGARIGRDKKSTEALLEAVGQSLMQMCGDLKSVAVPGFGTFVPEKHEEKISRDLSTGRTMLLPPEVVLNFTPASKLRKIAEKDNGNA